MRIESPLLRGKLLRRYKRFLADIELPGGEVITAHCPNTGSLLGCTPEGAAAVLRDSENPERKLRYTWQAVKVDGAWVNVDTSLPNGIVAEAIDAGEVAELTGYDSLRREVKYGKNSRIDILLERGDERCFVEVKSTTLAADGLARFPDAVTARGLKHLEELAAQAAEGDRAVIFFLVARDDVERFAPADEIDPEYGKALRRVMNAGVEALAYTTIVKPEKLEIARRLPIEV